MTENPLELPVEEKVKYLDGLKGHRNRVMNFGFILGLRRPGDFSGFVECIENFYGTTDHAGLHVTDPNWYEEGKYQTGIIEPGLLDCFDKLFRATKNLNDEQTLTPVCCFTAEPRGYQKFIASIPVRRPDLMICVEGGLFDHWGQYMEVRIVEGVDPFKLNTDASLIKKIKNKAKEVGKQEMIGEEGKQDWIESAKRNKEKDEAVERYFAEESARWAAQSEEI